MNIIDEIATALSHHLQKHGESELRYSVSIFSGAKSDKPTLRGKISGVVYSGIMFDASQADGLPLASVHLTAEISEKFLSSELIALWNAENRFTKIYIHSEKAYLSMDAFLERASNSNFESVAKIWSISMKNIAQA